jgi:hypothetical protein
MMSFDRAREEVEGREREELEEYNEREQQRPYQKNVESIIGIQLRSASWLWTPEYRRRPIMLCFCHVDGG